jgi:hypothetical protein
VGRKLPLLEEVAMISTNLPPRNREELSISLCNYRALHDVGPRASLRVLGRVRACFLEGQCKLSPVEKIAWSRTVNLA